MVREVNEVNEAPVGTLANNRKVAVARALTHASTAAMLVSGFVLSASAADAVGQKVDEGLKGLSGTLKIIGIAVAIICVMVAGFVLFTGGQQGMERAKQNIVRVLLGVALLALAPTIVSAFWDWTGGEKGDGGWENPALCAWTAVRPYLQL